MSNLAEGAIPLRERRTLADTYREFSGVLPKGASEIQRVEMRRAWYAGAAGMFDLMTGGLDADHEPTELDISYVESLFQELQQFARQLEQGKA